MTFDHGMRHTFRELVTKILPRSLKNALIDLGDRFEASAYDKRPSIPPPHAVKARIVINHAKQRKLRVLLETGTCLGEMARKCSKHFNQIWTIELSETLATEAAKRLAKCSNVRVLCGDSTSLLPHILEAVHEPIIFWLDAHYSGGITTKGATECPLERELQIIAEHACHDHTILIDDVRSMGSGDYPPLERVCELVRRINARYRIDVSDDILRCQPPEK